MSRNIAGALAPLLLVTACATVADQDAVDVTGVEAIRSLREAPDVAASAGPAAFEMSIAVPPGERALDVVATGVFDREAGRLAMEVHLGSALEGLAATGGGGVPPGMDEPVRVVIDGSRTYLRVPMVDALIGTSGWLAATADDLGGAAWGGGSYDPAMLLEVLRGVADDVEVMGTDAVRGVPTTRYAASVRLADVLATGPDGRLDQLGGPATMIPSEVWVDTAGLPRRVTMELAGPPPSGREKASPVTVSLELFDYGEPVTIDVPSPDEVTPYREAMAGMTRAFLEAGA